MAEQMRRLQPPCAWRTDCFAPMRQTFINRGLYQQRQDGTIREVEWVGWAPWLDQRAFAFVLDTGTLPVSIERLCDEKVIHQVSTALGGRRVEVVNHRGVAWLLAMDLPPLEEPQPRRRLPRQVISGPGCHARGLVHGAAGGGPRWSGLALAARPGLHPGGRRARLWQDDVPVQRPGGPATAAWPARVAGGHRRPEGLRLFPVRRHPAPVGRASHRTPRQQPGCWPTWWPRWTTGASSSPGWACATWKPSTRRRPNRCPCCWSSWTRSPT